MESFWTVAPEIPDHVRVMKIGLRVSLLGVNEVRELHGILDEEDGSVVANHVIVSFLSIEFNSESSRVSFSISSSSFTGNC